MTTTSDTETMSINNFKHLYRKREVRYYVKIGDAIIPISTSKILKAFKDGYKTIRFEYTENDTIGITITSIEKH